MCCTILCMSSMYVTDPACIWLWCEFSFVYKLMCVFGVFSDYSIVLCECPSVVYSSSTSSVRLCSPKHNIRIPDLFGLRFH